MNNFLILFFIIVKFWSLMFVLTLSLLISPNVWLDHITFKKEKSPRNFRKLVVLQKGKLQARFISCSQIFLALKLMKRWFIRMRIIQPWHTEIQSSMYVLICHCPQSFVIYDHYNFMQQWFKFCFEIAHIISCRTPFKISRSINLFKTET